MKKPGKIYFWWSASYVHEVKFVRWCRMRMHNGKEDTNKIGVGVIVESDWLFSKPIVGKVPHGLKRGRYRLRPYTDLYRSNDAAKQYKSKIRRPKLEQVK